MQEAVWLDLDLKLNIYRRTGSCLKCQNDHCQNLFNFGLTSASNFWYTDGCKEEMCVLEGRENVKVWMG